MQTLISISLLVILIGFMAPSSYAKDAAKKSKKKNPAESVEVELKDTKFEWKASKKMGKSHNGFIYLKSASPQIENGKLVGGEFVMDMNSFTVEDLKGSDWEGKFMDHVKSGDFFEVGKYPTAKFVIKEQVGENKVKGELHIKSKQQPLTVTYNKKGNTYTGKFQFDRTKFGINYGSESLGKMALDKIINDDVHVNFTIVTK